MDAYNISDENKEGIIEQAELMLECISDMMKERNLTTRKLLNDYIFTTKIPETN